MKSSNSSTSSYQILLLLAVAICLGGVASWGVRRFTPQPSELATTTTVAMDDQSFTAEPVAPSLAVSTRSEPADQQPTTKVSVDPTVILPRQPVMIVPEKLEKECRQFVERLLKQLPDDPNALNLAAMYYSQSYQTARADELWNKIVELQADDPIVYHNWSTNAIHQGDSERALEILDKAEQKGMLDPQLDYQRAIALSNLGRDAEVEERLAPLVASQQMTAALWLQLGLSQIKLGNHAAARDSLLEAQKLGINNKPLINGLISTSVRLRDREAAQRYQAELESLEEKITEFGQEQFQARSESRIRTFSLGILGEGIEVYRLAGRLNDAESTALRVLALEPNQLEVCQLLNRIYTDRNDLANQLVVLERLTELQPGYLLNYLMMAKAADLMGDHERAEALIKLTISLGPEDATSWIAMAEYLMEQQRPDRAVWYIERALEIEPNPQGQALLERAIKLSNAQTTPARSSGGNSNIAESTSVAPEADKQPARRFPTVRAQPEGRGP